MSSADDRIAVPTNGHRPPLALEPKPATPDAEDRTPRPPGVASRRGVAIEANPAALVVGFGVVAWLVVILVGARRRRS